MAEQHRVVTVAAVALLMAAAFGIGFALGMRNSRAGAIVRQAEFESASRAFLNDSPRIARIRIRAMMSH
jgi:hypothetical protein